MSGRIYFAAAESGRPHLPRKRWDRLESALGKEVAEQARERFDAAFLKVIAVERLERRDGTERGLALIRAQRIEQAAAKAHAALRVAHDAVEKLLSELGRLDRHTLTAIENCIPSERGCSYDTALPVRHELQAMRPGPASTIRLARVEVLRAAAACAANQIGQWPAANPGQPASVVSRLVWEIGREFAATGVAVSTSAEGPFARFIEAWHRLLPLGLRHRGDATATNAVRCACRNAVISFNQRQSGWLDQLPELMGNPSI